MTEGAARKVANVAIGVAALGAAYVVIRVPPLRRWAIGLAVTALTGAIPAWLTKEAQHAWAESGKRHDMTRDMMSG